MTRFLGGTLVVLLSSAIASADDWPTYRADAARSGYTAESLPGKLSLRWTYNSPHAPESAWPRDERMTFDRGHHVVIADGRLFFGNTCDGKVYALDAITGRTLWQFFTDSPARPFRSDRLEGPSVCGQRRWVFVQS